MEPVIVVGVDLSEESGRVVDAAAALAEDLGASMVLVHAVESLPYPGAGAEFTPAAVTQPEVVEDDAVTLSTEWAARARARGIATEVVVRQEVAHKLILDTAKRVGAALVVVGTHGRTGARRLLMGSVAERVVRHSDLPVLVVPAAPGQDAPKAPARRAAPG